MFHGMGVVPSFAAPVSDLAKAGREILTAKPRVHFISSGT